MNKLYIFRPYYVSTDAGGCLVRLVKRPEGIVGYCEVKALCRFARNPNCVMETGNRYLLALKEELTPWP